MPAVAATHSLEFIAGQEWNQAKEKKYARERNKTREEPKEENRKENDKVQTIRPLLSGYWFLYIYIYFFLAFLTCEFTYLSTRKIDKKLELRQHLTSGH